MSEAIARNTTPRRSRKRRETHDRILASAIALFRRSGVRATRSSRIAAAADVSPATLFNYFPTKADLAEAWVRRAIGAELLVTVTEAGDRSLRSTLRRRCRAFAESTWRDRDLLLEAWHVVGRAANPRHSPIDLVASWIGRAQDRGEVRRDLRSQALAEMLIDAIEGGLIHGLREGVGEEAVAAELRSRIDLVLDGMRRRNERVALTAGAGAGADAGDDARGA